MINKIEKWKEVSRGVALSSYLKVDKVIYHLPNGIEKDFYIKREGPAVGILALTKDQHIILVKQFRPGPNEILNELPGGYAGE